jgi:hypothetical protein
MNRIPWIAALAIAAIALAACGGGSSKSDTTPARTAAADESSFAKSMLLQLADFPAGWVLSNSEQVNEDSPLDQFCGTSIEDGRTGRAVTGDFAASDGAPTVSETVVVFPDADTAGSALDNVPDRIDCAIKAINDGKLDQPGVTFSKAESREAAVAAPGDGQYAYQIRMDAVSTDPAAPDNETVYFLLVYATTGRIGYSLTGTAYGDPFDVGQMSTTAKAAEAKIKQQP